jgi:predicted transcriptional regulator
MSNKEILATLFDDKTVRVLDKLLEKKGTFYLRELAKESDVSLATTYRIVQRLLELGVVEKKMHDKFVFYSLKANVPLFDELYGLLKGKKADPLESFCEKVAGLGVSIYTTKSNQLFVVGNADSTSIKGALDDLNAGGKKYKHMILKEDQFKQMVELGLVEKGAKRLI